MKLDPLRKKIDRLDAKVVKLLNERTAIALEIGRIKKVRGDEAYVPSRERAVLARVAAHSRGPLGDRALRAIYREVMSAALSLECGLRIGVRGGRGHAAAFAAREHFGGSVRYSVQASAASLLRAVQAGRVHYAFLPLADARRLAAGSFAKAFAEGTLRICASVAAGGGARFCVVGRRARGRKGAAR